MNISSTPGLEVRACIAGSLLFALSVAAVVRAAEPAALPPSAAPASTANATSGLSPLRLLVKEAIENNPEIRAARKELDAATQRIAPAGALDDPMLEAGILNLPTNSLSFRREDMTMKMLGLSQRFPYPGKRALKREVAEKDADSVAQAYQETVNRVAREVQVAYFDLALVLESARLVRQNRSLLEQLLKIAEQRYTVGRGDQVDVLRVQTQLSKMDEELIKLGREQPMFEAEVNRVLGRPANTAVTVPPQLQLQERPLGFAELNDKAIERRPQLLALRNIVSRNERSIELARKDRYPDFDVRLSYGQRENGPAAAMDEPPMRRSDMVSLTVAINLPVWRTTKIEPRIAEAAAMRDQALAMYEAQRNETAMKLRQQIATAEQSARAVRLYNNEIVPQSRLVVEAAIAAYQVNRLEFAPLLDNQMAILNFEIARVTAIANYNKALAEIEFLTGTSPL
jgi:outer membrane protein, heavy metal efflux system